MPKIHRESPTVQKNKFLRSYTKSLGILSPALTECRITYHTYKKWFTTDEKFRQKCLEVENFQGDYVENALMSQIEQGNIQAILFYLRCRRSDKWNDKSSVNINVITTEFQIGTSNNVELIDTKEIKMIEDKGD